ncbi:MAG: M15 family metallopeptidase [Spirochaetaceae bacterium]|nr:M15 family metallopeptidase [Spirochaetaceae bacterium]
MIFVLAGCALVQKEHPVSPDERAGRNLIIYWAENRNTRRVAKAIAGKTGGELFDIAGKKSLPNILDYETFFVGTSLAAGRIAAPLEEFLARTDVMDGRVIPFWTSREGAADLNGDFEGLLRGARFLRGGGFLFPGRVKAAELAEMAEGWAEAVLEELGLRRAAGGDYAEDMVKLFSAAYSGRLGPPVFQDGDWTVEMDGDRWYYAQGRFLPREDKDRPEEFRPQFLYRYAPEPPGGSDKKSPWQDMANQFISRRQFSDSYRPYPPNASPGTIHSSFFETIWQARSKEEAFSCQQRIDFLGRSVQIHRDIAAPLGRVDSCIQGLAKNDPKIERWIKNLHSITGWNWRNIAGSQHRSFHAYGAAVDLLMKSQAGMETYWQWTAAKGIDWRSVPVGRRQNPPAVVIRAFEEEGFIWGGRWTRYDTMHFEYHPELLILGTGRNDWPPQTAQIASPLTGNS